MGSISEEYTNQAAKELVDSMNRAILLDLQYPESYSLQGFVVVEEDIKNKIKWLQENTEENFAYHHSTFYFTNKKQKMLFLLRWAGNEPS